MANLIYVINQTGNDIEVQDSLGSTTYHSLSPKTGANAFTLEPDTKYHIQVLETDGKLYIGVTADAGQ